MKCSKSILIYVFGDSWSLVPDYESHQPLITSAQICIVPLDDGYALQIMPDDFEPANYENDTLGEALVNAAKLFGVGRNDWDSYTSKHLFEDVLTQG